MNTALVIETLKRLFLVGDVTIGELKGLLADGKISPEEYEYITEV